MTKVTLDLIEAVVVELRNELSVNRLRLRDSYR